MQRFQATPWAELTSGQDGTTSAGAKRAGQFDDTAPDDADDGQTAATCSDHVGMQPRAQRQCRQRVSISDGEVSTLDSACHVQEGPMKCAIARMLDSGRATQRSHLATCLDHCDQPECCRWAKAAFDRIRGNSARAGAYPRGRGRGLRGSRHADGCLRHHARAVGAVLATLLLWLRRRFYASSDPFPSLRGSGAHCDR